MSHTHKFYRWFAFLLIVLLIIPGCKSKSGLTQDDNYSITVISRHGEIQSSPVQLSWNSNMVVVQKFLMEATFTLSDLHTMENRSNKSNKSNDINGESEITNMGTILIKAQFPESRVFNLTIDDQSRELTLDSIEIEIDGSQPGRVILNDALTLQGIPDPNLKPSFDELVKMLHGTTPENLKSVNTPLFSSDS